jgi:hypothetical protein
MQIAYLSRQIEWEIQMVSGMPEGDKKKGAWRAVDNAAFRALQMGLLRCRPIWVVVSDSPFYR